MSKFITFFFSAIFCISCSNGKAQGRFNNYLSVYCKQIRLTDDGQLIHDEDYMTFEYRWLEGFEYEDFLPRSALASNMENCYFMSRMQSGKNTIGMLKITYDEDEVGIAKYLFVMYNDVGDIIDTLYLLSEIDTYKDIDNFFMSYIVLSQNEIQHVCVGPFSNNDVKTTCKKITYKITDNGFSYKAETSFGKIMVPDKVTDISL